MSAKSKRTPEGDATFFAALADEQTVCTACRAANYVRSCAYQWRRQDPCFAARWDAALAAAEERREKERALDHGRYDQPAPHLRRLSDAQLKARLKSMRRRVGVIDEEKLAERRRDIVVELHLNRPIESVGRAPVVGGRLREFWQRLKATFR